MADLVENRFWGREQERAALHDWNGKQSRLTVLYGRRRVGKTRLVEEAFRDVNLIRVEGLEGLGARTQQALFRQMLISRLGYTSLEKAENDWLSLLSRLSDCLGNKPAVVFLDEFQWLAGGRTALVSKLKHAWDNLFSKRNRVHLILCGSVSSFMVDKVMKSRSLYGRVDREIHLLPLLAPSIIEDFTAKRSLEETVEIFMTVGGIPQYLKMFDLTRSLRLNVEALFFSPNAYFVNEFERIFASHFGTNPHYREILLHLAERRWADRDSIKKAARSKSGGRISEYLSNLEIAGFVEKYVPVDKPQTERNARYRLCDPYLDFYFRFVHGNRKRINQGHIQNPQLQFLADRVYYPWRGLAFERFCYGHRQLIADKLGFGSVIFDAGPWFSRRTKDKSFQVDLVFIRADRVMTVCEIKFMDKKVGMDVIAPFEQRIQRTENPKRMSVEKILVTATEPTDRLRREGYFHRILTLRNLFG